MDFRRSLMFNKCYCCNKNFNVEQLIEINQNSVIIGDETIQFGDLLLDVCLIAIDPLKQRFICTDCKNQLVYFHMFKRDIKKYSAFNGEIRNLLLLSKVDCLLSGIESSLELEVSKQDDTIVISPCVKNDLESADDLMLDLPIGEQELEFIEEEYIEEPAEIYPSQELTDFMAPADECDESKADDASSQDETRPIVKQPKKRKYKYDINTNDKLTSQQKIWINQQVKECEVFKDNQVIYKCPLCETFLRIPGSLKKHLRDTHILKPEKAQMVMNNRKQFKSEIQQSKIVVETTDGPETIWKCQRCENNRIFRSEAGLKVHIRYTHIRSQKIDAKFIARCKVEYEDEHGPKVGWKCPECDKILSSRDGIRNHIKFEHPQLAEESAQSVPQPIESTARNESTSHESLLNLLERKRRTLKTEVDDNSCKDCGIHFINGTSKKEKSFKIHRDCHKILNVVAAYYQFPKCEVTKTMFVNHEDLETFFHNDQNSEPLPHDGMTLKVSEKFKEPNGSANFDDLDAWKCGHCGVKYQTEVECNEHLIILHSRKLICPVDYMEFEGSRGISQFNIHMTNKHSEMFPDLVIQCTYCQTDFSSIFEKLAHMKTCSKKKFECDHCSRKYFAKTELIRHLKLTTGQIAYVCDICSKTCASTMDLKLHRTSHTNERLYACTYPNCKKTFKTPTARSSHMETHGSISYDCSSCSATFRQRALLQRHIRKGFCKDSHREDRDASKRFVVLEEMFEEDDQLYEVSEVLH